MEQKNNVLLSIGIPTFNRAELLRSALYSLAPQIQEFQGEVELIVSNNNSLDNTEDVVKWAQQFGPIRYHRNNENIGAFKNYVLIATVLPKGEFVWILGDDDFVRPGAVKKVLETIKNHPNLDYIYINFMHFSTEQLRTYPHPISGGDLPNGLPLGNKDHNEYYVERWETLIRPDISEVFLGGIQMAIVRRKILCRYVGRLDIGEPYTSLASTYPQVILFAKGLIGKPAYYIGTPYVVVIDGAREWLEYVPKICLIYLHEALDCYELHGVDPDQIEMCRKFLVKCNGRIIMKILMGNNARDISGIFILQYVLKYWKYLGIGFIEVVFNQLQKVKK